MLRPANWCQKGRREARGAEPPSLSPPLSANFRHPKTHGTSHPPKLGTELGITGRRAGLWGVPWPCWLEMPRWLPEQMSCWQLDLCVAEVMGWLCLRRGQLSLDHILAFMQLSPKCVPPCWFESGKIHHDDLKNNPNSWMILALFFACSFYSPSYFLLHWTWAPLEQKCSRNKRSENTNQWNLLPVSNFSTGRRRYHNHLKCIFRIFMVPSSPNRGDMWLR